MSFGSDHNSFQTLNSLHQKVLTTRNPSDTLLQSWETLFKKKLQHLRTPLAYNESANVSGNERFSETVLRLSKELKIHENIAQTLLDAARNYDSLHFDQPYDVAVELFFADRACQLNLISTLFINRSDPEDLSAPIREKIVQFSDKLLLTPTQSNTIANLCNKLRNKQSDSHNTNIETLVHNRKIVELEPYVRERKQIAQCIFDIASEVELLAGELEGITLALIDTLEQYQTFKNSMSTASMNTREIIAQTMYETEHVAYLLLLTIISALDPYPARERTKRDDGPVLRMNIIISNVVKNSNWKTVTQLPQFHAFIRLATAINCQQLTEIGHDFESIADELSSSVKDPKIFHDVAQAIGPQIYAENGTRTRIVLNDDYKAIFMQVFSNFILNILYLLKKYVVTMQQNQIEAIKRFHAQQQLEGTHSEQQEKVQDELYSMTWFSEFIAAVHCNSNLSERFWTGNDYCSQAAQRFIRSSFPDFISQLASYYYQSHFAFDSIIAYLNLISSLIYDSSSTEVAFNLLVDNRLRQHYQLTLDFLFDTVRNVVDEAIRIQNTMPPQMEEQIESLLHDQMLELIHVFLSLIANIAEKSTVCMLNLSKSSKWNLLETIMRILEITQSPPILNGQVFRTLASFTYPKDNTPEAIHPAKEIWENILAQGVFERNQGILIQFEEERKTGKFPETSGFLVLLSAIISSGVPDWYTKQNRLIDSGQYWEAIKGILKGSQTNESESQDQWDMLSTCIQILFNVLNKYEPKADDFIDKKIVDEKGISHLEFKPPGFLIMCEMNDCSDVKNKIFEFIPRDMNEFELFRSKPQGEDREKAVLLVLKFMNIILKKRDVFAKLALQSKTGVFKNMFVKDLNLSKRIASIINLLGYKHNSEIRYQAICIIKNLTLKKQSTELVRALEDCPDQTIRLFGERLFHTYTEECPEEFVEADETDPFEYKDALYEEKTKQTIIDTLIYNANTSERNLTQFLCVDQKIKPNCLEVIISQIIMEPIVHMKNPILLSKAYCLIYQLCKHPTTYRKVFEVLIKSNFFGHSHIQHLNSPFEKEENEEKWNTLYYHSLNAKAYFLKIVALYIHTKGRSEDVKSIVEIMFAPNVPSEELRSTSGRIFLNEQSRAQIIEMMDDVPIREDPKPSEPAVIKKFNLERIKIRKDNSIIVYDTRGLIDFLKQKLVPLEAETLNEDQCDTFYQEVRKWNMYYERYSAISNFFEAWRYVIETTISKHLIDPQNRDSTMFALLSLLCNKLNQGRIFLRVEVNISMVILSILVKLREEKESKLLDHYTRWLPTDECLLLLGCVLRSICSQTSKKVSRENFYSILLNYLRYTHTLALDTPNSELLLDFSQQLFDRVCRDAVTLPNYSTPGPSIRLNALAYALLDTLHSLDFLHSKFISYFENHGYLLQIFDNMIGMEKTVFDKKRTSGDRETAMYAFESLMSLLTRFAQSKKGCDTLIRNGLLAKLSKCSLLDVPPLMAIDVLQQPDEYSRIPSSLEEEKTSAWIKHLSVPILRLVCTTMLILPDNKRVAEEVLFFVLANKKALSSRLESLALTSSPMHLQQLEEIRLITLIFLMLGSHYELIVKFLQNKLVKWELRMIKALECCTSMLKQIEEKNSGSSRVNSDGSGDLMLMDSDEDLSRLPMGILENGHDIPRLLCGISRNVISYIRKVGIRRPDNMFFSAEWTSASKRLTVKKMKQQATMNALMELCEFHISAIKSSTEQYEHTSLKFMETRSDSLQERMKRLAEQLHSHFFLVENGLHVLFTHLDYYCTSHLKIMGEVQSGSDEQRAVKEEREKFRKDSPGPVHTLLEKAQQMTAVIKLPSASERTGQPSAPFAQRGIAFVQLQIQKIKSLMSSLQ